MADSLFKKFGSTSFDANGEESASLFDTFDGSRASLLDWTAAVMSHELLNKGWGTATAGTKLEGIDPVVTKLNRMPTPAYIRQIKIGFPLLYVDAGDGLFRGKTLELSEIVTKWSFGYVLGALTPEEHERLGGALRVFPKLVAAMFKQRAHAAYDSGADQFDAGKVEFSSVELTKFKIGTADMGSQDGTGVVISAAELELVTSEIEGDVDGALPIVSGFDVTGEVNGVTDLVHGQVSL